MGCLTGGLGPGPLLNQSCDCDHMTRIPGLHTYGCQAMPKRGVDTEYPNQVLTLNALIDGDVIAIA